MAGNSEAKPSRAAGQGDGGRWQRCFDLKFRRFYFYHVGEKRSSWVAPQEELWSDHPHLQAGVRVPSGPQGLSARSEDGVGPVAAPEAADAVAATPAALALAVPRTTLDDDTIAAAAGWWEAGFDDEHGRAYWHNWVSSESQWHPPPTTRQRESSVGSLQARHPAVSTHVAQWRRAKELAVLLLAHLFWRTAARPLQRGWRRWACAAAAAGRETGVAASAPAPAPAPNDEVVRVLAAMVTAVEKVVLAEERGPLRDDGSAQSGEQRRVRKLDAAARQDQAVAEPGPAEHVAAAAPGTPSLAQVDALLDDALRVAQDELIIDDCVDDMVRCAARELTEVEKVVWWRRAKKRRKDAEVQTDVTTHPDAPAAGGAAGGEDPAQGLPLSPPTLTGGLLGGGEERGAAKVQELEELVAMLQQQLRDARIDPITEVVPLPVARERLQSAVARMISGDDAASPEFEKWDMFIRSHPEHIEEERRKLQDWTRKTDDHCKKALQAQREFVPADINRITKEELTSRGVGPTLVRRLFDKKILWWVWSDNPSSIAKFHAADLQFKFSIQGLDLTELRAVWACVPPSFENDASGEKERWRANFLEKLREVSNKAEAGTLSAKDTRSFAYKNQIGLFDSQTGLQVREAPPLPKTPPSLTHPFPGKRGPRAGARSMSQPHLMQGIDLSQLQRRRQRAEGAGTPAGDAKRPGPVGLGEALKRRSTTKIHTPPASPTRSGDVGPEPGGAPGVGSEAAAPGTDLMAAIKARRKSRSARSAGAPEAAAGGSAP